MEIDRHGWKSFISRPFTLLGTSIWELSYVSKGIERVMGMKLGDGLYIEHPKGMVSQYRREDEYDSMYEISAQLLISDPEHYKKFLERGVEMNVRAETALTSKNIKTLQEAVDLFIELVHFSTIAPYFAGWAIENKGIKLPEIEKLVKELRSVSYYPKVMNDIIHPLAMSKMKNAGFNDPNILDAILYQELISNNYSNVEKRLEQRKRNKEFIYYQGQDTWDSDSQKIIAVESGSDSGVREIRGKTACNGKAHGKARIVLTNDIKNIAFDKGDILVAVSTNPELMPLIHKAGAIVTNEGGVTSHAAVISRELNIPCIIGTKNATRFLKEGDTVEVDADAGIVKILNK